MLLAHHARHKPQYAELMEAHETQQRAAAQASREATAAAKHSSEERQRLATEVESLRGAADSREMELRKEYAEKRSADLDERKRLSRRCRELQTELAKAKVRRTRGEKICERDEKGEKNNRTNKALKSARNENRMGLQQPSARHSVARRTIWTRFTRV